MTWDEVKELGPFYALGALEKETAEAIEEYLRTGTPEQKSEIRTWCESVALMPLALPSLPVPEHLRGNLLSLISKEPQITAAAVDETQNIIEVDQPAMAPEARSHTEIDAILTQADILTLPAETGLIHYEDGHEASAQSAPDYPVGDQESQDNVYTFKPAQRAGSRPLTWMLLAATVLLTFATSYLWWQNNKLTRQYGDMVVKLREKEGEVEKIASPVTRVIAMAGNRETPEATAKVFWYTDSKQWVIHIYNLPALPTDKQYQLWYVTKESQKVSAAVFTADEGGRTFLRLTIPQKVVDGLAATAVTLEPKGGSDQPTGNIVLQGVI